MYYLVFNKQLLYKKKNHKYTHEWPDEIKFQKYAVV